MIQQYNIKDNLNNQMAELIIDAWKNDYNKVFHLKNDNLTANIRDFYEEIGNTIGEYKFLAEDVKLGDRSSQKANKIWMEVRYDSNIKDAYRHSSNPQPLHTDGSYIPDFSNAFYNVLCIK